MDDVQIATLSRRFDQIKKLIETGKIDYLAVLNSFERLVTESVGFEAWMTLNLRPHSPALNYRQLLKKARIGMSGAVTAPLYELSRLVSDSHTESTLTLVSLEMLGISHETYYDNACERAALQGLLLCSPRVGPELRMAYLSQPKGSRLVVMSPLIGRRSVFTLNHKVKAITLDCATHSKDRPLILLPTDQLVFALPLR